MRFVASIPDISERVYNQRLPSSLPSFITTLNKLIASAMSDAFLVASLSKVPTLAPAPKPSTLPKLFSALVEPPTFCFRESNPLYSNRNGVVTNFETVFVICSTTGAIFFATWKIEFNAENTTCNFAPNAAALDAEEEITPLRLANSVPYLDSFENNPPNFVDSFAKNCSNTSAEADADLLGASTLTAPLLPALFLFCVLIASSKTFADSLADLVSFSCLRIASSVQLNPVENLSSCR